MAFIVVGFVNYFFSRKVLVLFFKIDYFKKTKTGVNSLEFTPVLF